MSFLELKVPPVAVTLVFGFTMWIAAQNAPSLIFVMPCRSVIGLILALTGLVVGAMGIFAFHRANTTVNPFKPTDTSTIVSSGIYRVSRNPMYLGLLLVLGGWAIALSNVIAFAFLPAFVAYMTRFQIAPEERALLSKFGSEFIAYKESVRRWL